MIPSVSGARPLTAVATALYALLAAPWAGHAAPLFGLADNSQVVVRGRVESVSPYRDGSLQVFRIVPEVVLKGDATAGTPIEVVQEILFDTQTPYFVVGARTLLFAVPLPNYSSYRQALPGSSYLQWTERKDTAADVAPFGDPVLVEPVQRYLAVRDDPEATARHLASVLTMPVPLLRVSALAAIEARRELAPLLDAGALEPLRDFFRNEGIAVSERADVLVRLARVGAAGLGPIAEEVATSPGPLQAAGVDALVTLDRLPDEERLLTYSRSSEPALRLAAVRGLARRGSSKSLDRIDEMLTDDASGEVVLGALQALGGVHGEQSKRAVALLARTLKGSNDKATVNAAADGLGRQATPEALQALGDALAHGSLDAQTAAAFALPRSGKREAIAILREQEEAHPDPRVRKIIKIALGETPARAH